jgi:hypothetical protein
MVICRICFREITEHTIRKVVSCSEELARRGGCCDAKEEAHALVSQGLYEFEYERARRAIDVPFQTVPAAPKRLECKKGVT